MRNIRLTIIAAMLANLSCGIQDEPVRQRDDQSTLDPGAEGLILVSGDAQSGEVGSKLDQNFVIQARDAAGIPKTGASVEFKVVSGSGAVGGTQFTADKDGYVTASFQLATTIGPATVRATLLPEDEKDSNRNVYFNVVGVSSGPDHFSLVSGATCVAMSTETSWALKISDKYGNGISGGSATVTPTKVKVNDSTSPVSVPVGATGIVTFKVQSPGVPFDDGHIKVEGPAGKQYSADIIVGKKLWFKSDAGLEVTQSNNEKIFTPKVRLVRDGCVPLGNHQVYAYYDSTKSTNQNCHEYNSTVKTDADGFFQPTCAHNVQSGTDYYYHVEANEAGQNASFLFTIHVP